MIVFYIIILGISALTVAFGLTFLTRRFSRALNRPTLISSGLVALGVSLAFLLVVSAPWWFFVILAALGLIPRLIPSAPSLKWIVLALAVPLAAAPILGAPNAYMLDALILASAVLGEHLAS